MVLESVEEFEDESLKNTKPKIPKSLSVGIALNQFEGNITHNELTQIHRTISSADGIRPQAPAKGRRSQNRSRRRRRNQQNKQNDDNHNNGKQANASILSHTQTPHVKSSTSLTSLESLDLDDTNVNNNNNNNNVSNSNNNNNNNNNTSSSNNSTTVHSSLNFGNKMTGGYAGTKGRVYVRQTIALSSGGKNAPEALPRIAVKEEESQTKVGVKPKKSGYIPNTTFTFSIPSSSTTSSNSNSNNNNNNSHSKYNNHNNITPTIPFKKISQQNHHSPKEMITRTFTPPHHSRYLPLQKPNDGEEMNDKERELNVIYGGMKLTPLKIRKKPAH